MADNNLEIIKVGQQASRDFFNSFNRNTQAVFDASVAADQAKLGAAESVATFALNKVSNESAMRAREAQIRIAGESNRRAQEVHDFQFSEESIQRKRDLHDLNMENLTFAQEQREIQAKDAEINKYFTLAAAPILDDMSQTYTNNYNRQFANETQRMMADIKAKVHDGQLTPQEGAAEMKKKYAKIKSTTGLLPPTKWTEADNQMMTKHNPEVARRLNFKLNDDFANERNGVASSAVTGSTSETAGVSNYNKYLQENPSDAQRISAYRGDVQNIDGNIARLEALVASSLRNLPDYTPEGQAQARILIDERLNEIEKLNTQRADIGQMVRDGVPYGQESTVSSNRGVPTPDPSATVVDVPEEDKPIVSKALGVLDTPEGVFDDVVGSASEIGEREKRKEFAQLKEEFQLGVGEILREMGIARKAEESMFGKFIDASGLDSIAGDELDAGSGNIFSSKKLDDSAEDKIKSWANTSINNIPSESELREFIEHNSDKVGFNKEFVFSDDGSLRGLKAPRGRARHGSSTSTGIKPSTTIDIINATKRALAFQVIEYTEQR